MVNVIEAVYNKGKILTENANIPDNSKILIIWDSNNYNSELDKSRKMNLPGGIVMHKVEVNSNPLKSFPEDAVEFQRILRDGDWN